MRILPKYANILIRIQIIIGFLIYMSACEDSLHNSPASDFVVESGDYITVTGSVNIPEMTKISTRGEMSDNPDADLKLTILEFDYVAGNSMASNLTNVYKAELKTNSTPDNDGKVAFKVTLKSTKDKKVLHFLLADEYFDIPESEYASEAVILPTLTVGDRSYETDKFPEAYWGKVILEDGYDSNSVRTSLTDIYLIRNFAKISVELNPEKKDIIEEKFELVGLMVFNMPTSGTVAPWMRSTLSTPELLKTDENGKPLPQMKKYKDILYTGILPGNVNFINNGYDNFWKGADWSSEKYIYERPYQPTQRTFIIVKGLYSMSETNMEGVTEISQKEVYYKIDLVQKDDDGNFKYFNIIRNFHYKITINSVTAPGESEIDDAIAGLAFNNISASTDTESMLSMSDGKNLIMTNRLNYILVNDEPFEFMYRYLEGIEDGVGDVNNSKDAVKINIETGDVIAEFSGPDYDSNPGWVTYKITPNAPNDEIKTQEFTVVDKNGLGRTVHLMLRKPWQYSPIVAPNGDRYDATVAPGDNNLYAIDDPAPKVISSASGAALTVYFNLPDDLPEALFPLEFQLESKYQWIENNPIGTMVVTSGPSLYPDKGITISYLKKVSYDEYRYQYQDDGSNTINPNRINVNHTVRCRFRTIVAEAGPAEIRIHNPYFNTGDESNPDASVEFMREEIRM